ncbi:hypothetical protein N7494_001381 [Penicillium frequentans]|uniref:DUF5872 domain-containing protein n=1 Tax=Penicillium frequentans TaxID=3151616 RepID=A0AAD6D7Y1_9EURO|nr:hypothetical protein N7494_001381 [Penicillium glabrum]
MAPKDKYTDPELRDEVKEEIHKGDKGGKPGQWSARKAQMMASEYKKRGGSYNTSKEDQSESQKHLDQWSKEDWQTKEGSGTAKKEDGTRKRYLPKEAWEQMSDDEKEKTDDKKVKESKKGKQFVGNTTEAKSARKKASRDSADSPDEDSKANGEGKKHQTRTQTRRSSRLQDKADGEKNGASQNSNSPKSKKRTATQSKSSNKKKKNESSKEE